MPVTDDEGGLGVTRKWAGEGEGGGGGGHLAHPTTRDGRGMPEE